MILRKYSITLIVPILATNATEAEEAVLNAVSHIEEDSHAQIIEIEEET